MAGRLINMSSHSWRITARLGGCALALGWLFASHLSMAQDDLAEQRVQYDDDSPKTILELQPFRSATRADIQGTDGVSGTAELINLPHRERLVSADDDVARDRQACEFSSRESLPRESGPAAFERGAAWT